jgi:membrane protease YdiL (CAAX protease family)
LASYDSITIPYLLWVLGVMPFSGVYSYFRVRAGKPLAPKNRRYRAMILMQLLIVFVTLEVAKKNGAALFAGNWPAVWIWVVSGLYLGLIALRLNTAWGRMSAERKQRARLLLPDRPRQIWYWLPVALLAGLSEECAFRGMAYLALREIIGSASISVAICVVAFAVAHMMQGWRGVLGTGLIAIVMHGLVFMTQGLYLAIGLHAAYDVVVGVIALRHFMRDDSAPGMQPQTA